MKKIALLILVLFFTACAVNGKHMYVDGKCLSCWNNPLTGDALNYSKADVRNTGDGFANQSHAIISWQEMILEGLSRSGASNLNAYGEDYLKYQEGSRISYLKSNEISYQKKVSESVLELKSAVENHVPKSLYQITLASEVGKYDFLKKEFPVRLFDRVSLLGSNSMVSLPREITVSFDNFSEVPNLKMMPNEAERFLDSRNKSRGIYIRYIFEVSSMISASAFRANIKKIQFLDLKPSMESRNKKEKYPSFKSVEI